MRMPVPTMPAPVRRTLAWVSTDSGRRLGGWILGALIVALMTGPSGSAGAPTAGFTGSLLHPRVLVFLGIGVALWMLTNVRRRYGERIRAASEHVTGTPSRLLQTRRARYGLYVAVLAVAIAYPPTLSGFWQEVLVDQIGVFVLLAVGLNVVVGYAGLLDLGYIAFYAIGAYSGAYWTGALPVHPPFHVNPFWAIPLAVLLARSTGATPKGIVVMWNVLGVLDLVTAVALGATSAAGPLRIFHGEPGTAIMTNLPWVLIPCFLVPSFLFLHLCTFYRLRAAEEQEKGLRTGIAGVEAVI